jgi:penicillin-binding protein 1A
VVALSLCIWTTVGAAVWFVHDIATDLPHDQGLREVTAMAQATTLLDIKGQPAFTIYREQRIEVPLSRVSSNLIRAVLAVEDQRFYEHGGVDLVRVMGAAMSNLRQGRAAQGGSTLTQQLARQSFLTPDKTLRRKLKEVVVAGRLEQQFSKDDILRLYLNKVYFGDGLYGVEAASLGYFGKHAADVNVAEAALLAGLVKSPSSYAPTVSLERAVTRRNVVLQEMREAGVIDRRTYVTALNTPVQLTDSLRREEGFGQYFKEEVRKQLVQKFGSDRVYQGGLKVYTTLDLDVQKAAEAEVQRSLADIEQRARRRASPVPARVDAGTTSGDPLQAALVAMDPTTGEVRAMVGGRDFDQSHFNRATQAKRQAGSAFKPFVYAAALERGYTPATVITNLNDPIMTLQGAWVPEDEHSSSESMTMRQALKTSSNRAAVRMLDEVGIPTTVQYAQRLGVGSIPSVPSLALGSGEVTLLSMTAAYAAFANEGMVPTPTLIRRVETTSGEVLYDGAQPAHRAVSEVTAFLMTSMLADVINAGTAWPARRVGFTLPAAGKTGTTNDYHDAWFVGYTPHLVAGVWVGYDQPRTIMRNGYAADLAVPLWGRFMMVATRNDEPDWFTPPANIGTATICRISGQLATDGCRAAETVDDQGNLTIKSMAYTEYFVRGTEPTDYCPIHGYGTSNGLVTIATSGSAPEPLAPPAPPSPTPQPPPPTPRSRTSTEPAVADRQTDPQQQKRRGFWSRVFRRGGDQDQKADEPKERSRDTR